MSGVQTKEKKPPRVAKKTEDSKPSAPHPPYFQMIKEAILALHEKTGSSPHAIAKYMEENHNGVLSANFRKMLAIQLKNFSAKGKLVKVKASFKLSEEGKNDSKPSKEKAAVKEKKVKAKEASSGAAKRVQKKKSVASVKSPKKAAVRKIKSPAKPKQPKSIKSPSAKRTRKAVA